MNRYPTFAGRGAAAVLAVAVSAVLVRASGQVQVPAAPQGVPSAQTPRDSKPGTGVIVGTAADGSTGQPIAGAIVTLNGPGATRPKALTGADGRFAFTNLPEGAYTFIVGHSGYFPGQFGAMAPARGGVVLDLADGERRSDIVVKMWKNAAITGRITDEAGDPAVNVAVQAWTRQPAIGVPDGAWSAQQTTRTDDRGVYRLSGLVPGVWLVFIEQTSTSIPSSVLDAIQQDQQRPPGSVSPLMNEVNNLRGNINPPGNMNARQVGDHIEILSSNGSIPATNDGAAAAFVSQFYPAAATPATATPITIASGEERRGIDLQLRVVKTVRVSGSVTGPDGPVALTRVTLAPQFSSAPNIAEGSTMTDANGRFTFLRVPEGQHVLQLFTVPPVRSNTVTNLVQNADGTVSASSSSTTNTTTVLPPDPTLFAEVALVTGDKDIDNVAVVVRHGARISGRIEPPAGTVVNPAALQRITINLQRADRRAYESNASPRVRVDEKGEVTSQGFGPGPYVVSVNSLPPGWALSSVMHGGVDVSQKPLDLSADVDGLVFTFTTKPSQLSGVVRSDRNLIVPGALIMIFPADAPVPADGFLNPRRFVRPIASSSGTYSARNLPAGDYFVVAMAPDDPDNMAAPAGGFFSADIVTRLRAQATRITISAAEQRTLDLVAKGR